MKTAISRRSLLIGLGGGLAVSSIAWSIGGFNLSGTGRQAVVPAASDLYVDHEGWLLTVDDKAKVVASANIRQLDNTNLPGGDIGNRVVADVSACALWCMLDSRCKSFVFTKPAPEVGRPNMCWIKDSVPEAVPSEFHVAGIVE